MRLPRFLRRRDDGLDAEVYYRRRDDGLDAEVYYQRPCLIELIGEFNRERFEWPTPAEAFCALLEGRPARPACRRLPKQLPPRTKPKVFYGDIVVMKDGQLLGVYPHGHWQLIPSTNELIVQPGEGEPAVTWPAGTWDTVRHWTSPPYRT